MKIAIIGAGAMGGAIARGLLQSGQILPGHLTVSNRSAARLEPFANQGVSVTTDNQLAAQEADILVVAVKPWLVEEVLTPLDTAGKTVVSVAAGISGEQIARWTAPSARLWLAMPNMAAAQCASMTFLVPVRGDGGRADVEALFAAVGQTLVTDERHLGAATALSGCGIAYAMRYVRAASEGGVELGFNADVAKQIVLQTLRGAVTLLEGSGLHPEQAIDQVTTPGGMTIRGLNAMEHHGFSSAVISGLKASLG